MKLHIIVQYLPLCSSCLILANWLREIEKGTKRQVGSAVGGCVVGEQEKRKENEVFLDVFTVASGVF